MINTKMIIFEGIPGSGKTTTSQLLHKYFLEKGIHSKSFIEGCEHPIDLPFYAFLSQSEYNSLILEYQQQAKWLQEYSIIEDNYVLTPYKIPEPYPCNDSLIEYLRVREFCYSIKPIVSFDTFKKVFYRRFEQYVDRMLFKNEITIFESVLLQHQIHDINRLYPNVHDDEIVEYLRQISDILAQLNPVLFYISQSSVRESLKNTALIRSKPKWSEEGTIVYYEKRKKLELHVIKNLCFHAIVLDNSDYNWDKMFDAILKQLDLEGD